MAKKCLSPALWLAVLPALLLVLFRALPAAADDALIEGYVPWMRPDALYVEGRGEFFWGEWREPATGATQRTRCFEAQRGIDLDCASLATAGFIQRARLTVTADGRARRIDVLEMRQ